MPNTLNTVALPDNLYWSDEYEWSPVEQAVTPTLTGALIVEESTRLAGRPITLDGMWVPRSTVEAVRALAAQPATPRTLTLADGRTFTVLFRHSDGQPVEAKPLWDAAPDVRDAADTYTLTLRLMET